MCALVGPYSISNYTLGVIYVFPRSVKKSYALLVLAAAGAILAGCSSGTDEVVESFDPLTVINEHCAVDWSGGVYLDVANITGTSQEDSVQSPLWMSIDFLTDNKTLTVDKAGHVTIEIFEKHESQLFRDCREDAKNTRWRR